MLQDVHYSLIPKRDRLTWVEYKTKLLYNIIGIFN